MSGNNRSGRYSEAALTQAPLEHHRLSAVEEAFATLPQRYLGADPGFSASYRIELGDLGLSWAVEMNELACEVSVSPKSDPDVVIGTDAETSGATLLFSFAISGIACTIHAPSLYSATPLEVTVQSCPPELS